MTTEARYDVVGIGNALLDVLSDTTDEFLKSHDLAKGTMTLIDAAQASRIYEGMKANGIECSGGSAANTMAGIASLGGKASFIGRVHNDALGELFRKDMTGIGVHFAGQPAELGQPTGRSMILVSPDAQRTMQTFLGAAAELTPDDVHPEAIKAASITYLEGYLWDPPPAKEAFLKAARIAHEAGRMVSLTLSDPFCVDRHRDDFLGLIADHVDIVFANEDEALALFQTDGLDAALDRFKTMDTLTVVTRSEKGSVVLRDGNVVAVPAAPIDKVVDTTGAGDSYAAGFLFGVTRGLDDATCARIGGIAAAEVISHYGARPKVPLGPLVQELAGGAGA